MTKLQSNFLRVSEMNSACGNPRGNPLNIDVEKLRVQCRNILNEYCELQMALGADPLSVQSLRLAGQWIVYPHDLVDIDGVRKALCDAHVLGHGAQHIMGVDADSDMTAVVDGQMTRFIKDDADKLATIALHASKGVREVYFEGKFPTMLMKSAVDQPEAPRGAILNSASYAGSLYSEQ